MSYWNKDTEDKLNECVYQICEKCNDQSMFDDIYDIVDEFAKYLHLKTCERMIDYD